MRKLKGTVKLVSEMSGRESRYKRKQWRTNQRNKRAKDKYITTINTPPPTPEGSDAQRQENQNSDERQQVNKNMGRKRVRRDRAKAYRRLFHMQTKLESEKRNKEKYKKKYYRLQLRSLTTPQTAQTHYKKSRLLFKVITERIRRRYQGG